ncbi:MAG: hypothetical protein RL199_2101 [Pseudomonadota bacterium]
MSAPSDKNRRPDPTEEAPISKELTKSQLRKIADETVEFINKAMRESGRSMEKVGAHLFETLLDADVEAALVASKGQLPKYVAVAERAGESLLVDRSTLSRLVRVGAVTHALGNDRWVALPWTMKVELLPLLGAGMSFDVLLEGVDFAGRKGVGTRALREWVASRKAGAPAEGEAETKGPRPTLARTRRLLEFAPMLQKVADRRIVAEGVSKLSEKERAAFASGLRATIRHLTKLAEEMEIIEA